MSKCLTEVERFNRAINQSNIASKLRIIVIYGILAHHIVLILPAYSLINQLFRHGQLVGLGQREGTREESLGQRLVLEVHLDQKQGRADTVGGDFV